MKRNLIKPTVPHTSKGYKLNILTWILCLSFIFLPYSYSQTRPVEDPNNYERASRLLADHLREIQSDLGINGVRQELKHISDLGININPLKQFVLNSQNGYPFLVKIFGHESERVAINYANQQLIEMGIDFYQFELEIDPNAVEISQPKESHRSNYKKWQKIRSIVLPFIGIAAVFFTEAHHLKPHGHPEFVRGILQNMGVGLAIMGLEVMFAYTSNWWNINVWSKNYPVQIKFPQLVANEKRVQKIAHSVFTNANRLSDLTVNRLSQKVGYYRQAHLYSFLVNWAYSFIIYGVAQAGFYATGYYYGDLNLPELTLSQHISKVIEVSFVGNAIYYATFSLWLINIGTRHIQGQISEELRYKLETLPYYYANFFRAAAALWGNPYYAYGALIGFGLMATLPATIDTETTHKRNRKIRQMFFEDNKNNSLALCLPQFSRLGRPPILHKKQNLTGLIKAILSYKL